MKPISQIEPDFDEKEAHAVFEYMQSGGWITEFKQTEKLEQMLAEFTRAKYCLMTPNGTISIILALLALNLQRGDEILVPNLTMIATPNAAALLGLKPVLVDVESATLCMDIKKAEQALTKHTKAVVYVPLHGRSGDMREVTSFCQKNTLYLIEDAAQALGSFYKKKHLGTFGDIGTLSFSVPKVITTGQGGAVLINSARLYKKLKLLKDFGRTRGGIDTHDAWGWNFKFTDLQAVVGIIQMKKLPQRLKRKKEIFKMYQEWLSDIPEIKFINTDFSQTSPWFIDIYVSNPNKLQAYLKEQNIGSRRIYPVISSQKIYKSDYKTADFPVSKKYASRGLWLPSSTTLTDADIERVTKAIRRYYI